MNCGKEFFNLSCSQWGAIGSNEKDSDMTSGFGDISLWRFSDWCVGVAWMRTRAKEQGNEVASGA